MTNKMYTENFQDVEEYCGKCLNLQKIYEKKKTNTMTLDDLGKFRYICSYCRLNAGIFKGDAILGAYMLKKDTKLPKGKGRSSVIPAGTVEAILEQIEQGVSYKVIAERTGISESTIYRIKKRNSKKN